MKAEIAKISAPVASFFVAAAMARTATSGQRKAIRAKCPAGQLQHVKAAATLARRVFIAGNGWVGFPDEHLIRWGERPREPLLGPAEQSGNGSRGRSPHRV